MFWHNALVLALLALAGCGGQSRTFDGVTGNDGGQLVAPPPARLAIPTPKTALLDPTRAAQLATALTIGLRAMEVPAFAQPASRGDWVVEITAQMASGMVTPSYIIRDPSGLERNRTAGAAVPEADWIGQSPVALGGIVSATVPALGTALTAIEARRRQDDPTSLLNRPARIYVPDVTGAPGDGNTSLARQMRRELPQFGLVVLEKPERPDFTVIGTVKVGPLPKGQESVEITWVIQDDRGAEAGKIAQLNQVAKNTLSGLWVDIAVVVAEEAAGGVRDVILNRLGTRKKP